MAGEPTGTMIYEGKAKKIFTTERPDQAMAGVRFALFPMAGMNDRSAPEATGNNPGSYNHRKEER